MNPEHTEARINPAGQKALNARLGLLTVAHESRTTTERDLVAAFASEKAARQATIEIFKKNVGAVFNLKGAAVCLKFGGYVPEQPTAIPIKPAKYSVNAVTVERLLVRGEQQIIWLTPVIDQSLDLYGCLVDDITSATPVEVRRAFVQKIPSNMLTPAT